jgi:hypothetical protein
MTVALLSMALGTSSLVRADEEKTTSTTSSTTITSDGTVSEYSPDAVMVRTTSSAAPIRYVTSRTTTYVDENGNPVSVETVKSGLPVTVFYDRQGDQLMASRVVVHRAAVVEPSATAPATTIQKSTTTTKIKKDDDD